MKISQFVKQTTGTSIYNWMSQKATTEAIAAAIGSNLNGTNYVMVYGTGTPTENGAELLAAYEEAKTMPRYLGTLSDGPTRNLYVGQIYLHGSGSPSIRRIKVNYTGGTQSIPTSAYDIIDTAGNAFKYEDFRTTVIVAPGTYTFGTTKFNINAIGVNVASLTGNADVIIDGIAGGADYTYIKGFDCGVNSCFNEELNTPNSIYENITCGEGFASGTSGYGCNGTFIKCIAKGNGFATSGTLLGTYIDCEAAMESFGGYGAVSATLIRCIGGADSFGGGGTISSTARLENCKLSSGTFPTPTGSGKLYNCISGNGALVNYPALSASIPSDANLPGSPTTTTQLLSDRSTKVATTAFARSKYVVTESNAGNPTEFQPYADIYLINLGPGNDDLLRIPFGNFTNHDCIIKNIGVASVGLASEDPTITLDNIDINTSSITIDSGKSIHIMCIAENKWVTLSSNL